MPSRRHGEQDREAERSRRRGVGGEDGGQPREECLRAGAEGAREPPLPRPQVPGRLRLLQQGNREYRREGYGSVHTRTEHLGAGITNHGPGEQWDGLQCVYLIHWTSCGQVEVQSPPKVLEHQGRFLCFCNTCNAFAVEIKR